MLFDVVYVECLCVDGVMFIGYCCEWIGSSGIGIEVIEIFDVMMFYYECFFDSDLLFVGLCGKIGMMLVVCDIVVILFGEFC